MRLIDLDKHFELNEPFYKADIEMPLHRVKAALESLPTIEAIPVEWLKQWEEKHKNDPCYCGFVSEEIIKDWEKENETNRF